MGESKRKKRAHAGVFAACPTCIYCGGDVQATTIDHVPPRIMFSEKRRPKGLEFASCEACNQGTRRADLVAAMMARLYPDAEHPSDRAEISRIFTSINNNIPGLLQEMHIDEAGQAKARMRLPSPIAGGFLRTDGPLVSPLMQTFAFKTGFALYYEMTKKIVPKGGAVAARWFSNFERMTGTFPSSALDFLLPPETLRQGSFGVPDQFSYQWRIAEGDRVGAFASFFRSSFAVLAFVSIDKSLLRVETAHPMLLCEPGEILKLIS